MTNLNAGASSVVTARFWNSKRVILLGLNLVLYAFLIRWVVRNIDFHILLRAFEQIPRWAILLSILLNFGALILYGMRMELFLFRNFFVSFATVNIGYAYNTILPFRLGDAMKVYYCCRLFGLRISEVVAATVAEKLVDLCKLLVLGGIIVYFSAGRFVQIGAVLSLAAVVVLGVVGLLVSRYFIVRIVRLMPKRGAFRRGIIGLFRHSDRYQLGKILLMTLAVWSVNIVLFYVAFNTYLPGVSVGILGAIAMLVITALTIALPSAPAGIGLFEAGIVAYLSQANQVPYEKALAAATVFHLVVTVPQIFIALLWIAYIKRFQKDAMGPGGSTVVA